MSKKKKTQPKKQRALKLEGWESMVMDPGESPAVATPTLQPYESTVATFTRTFGHAPSADGSEFAFHVRPDPLETLRVETETSLNLNAGDYVMSQTVLADVSGPANACRIASIVAIPNVNAPETATAHPVVVGIKPDGTNFNPAVLTLAANQSVTFTTTCRDAVTVRFQNVATQDWFERIIQVNLPATFVSVGADYSNFEYIRKTSLVTSGEFELSITAGSANAWALDSITYTAFSTQASQLAYQRISTWRMTAMSIHIRYVGSSLTNGGKLAIARTKYGWNPGAKGSAYSQISQLPTDRYVGALRDGAYCWWLPLDMDELNARPWGAMAPEFTSIWAAGSFDSVESSLEITIAMTLEFASELQLFSLRPNPALTDDFVRLYHALKRVPAAMCNPSHTKILNKVKAALVDAATRGVDFALAHPELVAQMAMAVV